MDPILPTKSLTTQNVPHEKDLPSSDLDNTNKSQIVQPISILKRPEELNTACHENSSSTIYPRLPYHVRYARYIQRRNELFELSSCMSIAKKRPKRSTKRMRLFFKTRKLCRKFLVSAILSNPKDMRYYAKVSFLDFSEYGLLDTGASISCLGSNLASTDFTKYPNFFKCKSFVKTADGNKQAVVGWFEVIISFKNKTSPLKLFIIPSISQRLILGIDFWSAFDLIPDIIGSIDLLASDEMPKNLSDLESMNGNSR